MGAARPGAARKHGPKGTVLRRRSWLKPAGWRAEGERTRGGRWGLVRGAGRRRRPSGWGAWRGVEGSCCWPPGGGRVLFLAAGTGPVSLCPGGETPGHGGALPRPAADANCAAWNGCSHAARWVSSRSGGATALGGREVGAILTPSAPFGAVLRPSLPVGESGDAGGASTVGRPVGATPASPVDGRTGQRVRRPSLGYRGTGRRFSLDAPRDPPSPDVRIGRHAVSG